MDLFLDINRPVALELRPLGEHVPRRRDPPRFRLVAARPSRWKDGCAPPSAPGELLKAGDDAQGTVRPNVERTAQLEAVTIVRSATLRPHHMCAACRPCVGALLLEWACPLSRVALTFDSWCGFFHDHV